MNSKYNLFMDAVKHNVKRLQIASWYMLMEGAERTLKDVGDIVNQVWDGNKWRGDDNQFGQLLADMVILEFAVKHITPPDFIEKQHLQLVESIEYYIQFLIHANMGKPNEAKANFDKSQELRNASLVAIQSVEKALEG